MLNLLRIIWFQFLEIIFPVQCLGCRKPKILLCSACENDLTVNQTLFCGFCGRRLALNRKVCHQDFPYLLGAAGSYKNPVLRELIRLLKYRRHQPAAEILARFLKRYLEALGIDFTPLDPESRGFQAADERSSPLKLNKSPHLIKCGNKRPVFQGGDLTGFTEYALVPIPLHKKRLKQRGFNQAEIIARELLRIIGPGGPRPTDYLARIKNNQPQALIADWKKRRANIQGCFKVINIEQTKNKPVIIIDDVSTSGATLREAATVLRKAGARKIIGLVVAKS